MPAYVIKSLYVMCISVCMCEIERVYNAHIKKLLHIHVIIKSPWSTQHEVGGPFDQILSCQVSELHTQHLVHLPYRRKQILYSQNVKKPEQDNFSYIELLPKEKILLIAIVSKMRKC